VVGVASSTKIVAKPSLYLLLKITRRVADWRCYMQTDPGTNARPGTTPGLVAQNNLKGETKCGALGDSGMIGPLGSL
jgi:hypothetical protein